MKKIDRFVFNVADLLGAGSFGQVYLGTDTTSGNKVAIKIIPSSMLQDPILMTNFHNEIYIQKLLSSKNIVKLYEVLQTSNNYYMVVEYCRNGDLRKKLKEIKMFPESEALKIMEDILTGFLELQRLGVVHRDLKPENILIDRGACKLADFGFSKTVDNFKQGMLTSALGTPLYMSPQIQMAQHYTSKSDIWSIGMIYYELLYGKTPWTANSQYELLQNIKNKPLQFPSQVLVSDQSKDFIRQCLQFEESNRINWEQIFVHNLFNNCFQYKEKLSNLTQRKDDILNKLIYKINCLWTEKGKDIDWLFQQVDQSKDQQLQMDELQKLLGFIDSNIQREEVEFIFNCFDIDGDGNITLQEFKTTLAKAKQQHDQHMNKTVLQRQDTEHAGDSKAQGEAKIKWLQSYSQKFPDFKSQTRLIFNKFSHGDSSSGLSYHEFGDLLRALDQNISNQEILYIFGQFDNDNDYTVTQEEFYFKLTGRLLNDPEGSPQINQQQYQYNAQTSQQNVHQYQPNVQTPQQNVNVSVIPMHVGLSQHAKQPYGQQQQPQVYGQQQQNSMQNQNYGQTSTYNPAMAMNMNASNQPYSQPQYNQFQAQPQQNQQNFQQPYGQGNMNLAQNNFQSPNQYQQPSQMGIQNTNNSQQNYAGNFQQGQGMVQPQQQFGNSSNAQYNQNQYQCNMNNYQQNFPGQQVLPNQYGMQSQQQYNQGVNGGNLGYNQNYNQANQQK